jgi:hypothetical protein
MKKCSALPLICGLVILTSCQSAINKAGREAKYSAYEMVGIQKRDLFKKEVKNVKDDQKDAGENFKDALDRLKEVYAFDGGNLEKKYRSLNSSYEDAEKSANQVHLRVAKIETVAQDLFEEWRKEIQEISTPSLRQKSMASLEETQKKYREFYGTLKRSEAKMTPVLAKFKDQVLFLKHNLNAQAITGLKGESNKIEGDIESLIKDMNTSVSQAEDFIKTM